MSSTREELLAALREVSVLFPAWRLGQMVANLAAMRNATPEGVWDSEDEQLLAAARQLVEANADREPVAISTLR